MIESKWRVKVAEKYRQMTKSKPLLSVRIPLKIDSLLEMKAQELQRTKSQVAIAALEQYFELPQEITLADRVLELERKVARLEQAARAEMHNRKASLFPKDAASECIRFRY